jgi:hypothetical protein
MVLDGLAGAAQLLERAPMQLDSPPARRLRSRPGSGLHALTDLTALAMFRLSASPRQGITIHSVSLSTSVSPAHYEQGAP